MGMGVRRAFLQTMGIRQAIFPVFLVKGNLETGQLICPILSIPAKISREI